MKFEFIPTIKSLNYKRERTRLKIMIIYSLNCWRQKEAIVSDAILFSLQSLDSYKFEWESKASNKCITPQQRLRTALQNVLATRSETSSRKAQNQYLMHVTVLRFLPSYDHQPLLGFDEVPCSTLLWSKLAMKHALPQIKVYILVGNQAIVSVIGCVFIQIMLHSFLDLISLIS